MSENKLSFKTPESEQRYIDAYNETLKLWRVPYESFYVSTEHGNTHIIACGPKEGEPLILLNGFGFSATMWYPNVEELSKNHRVYAIDVMGDINKSILTKTFKDKTDCARWLSDVLDKLQIKKAVIAGHSAGGFQTINFAINYPDRVKKIILMAPAASFAPFYKQFYLRLFGANIIRTRSMIINSFCNWFIAKGNKVSSEIFEQFYYGLIGFKFSKVIIPSVFTDEELHRISAPTLMMIGDKEVIYDTKAVIERAKRLVKNIEIHIVKNAGHGLTLEQSDTVNAFIKSFLEEN